MAQTTKPEFLALSYNVPITEAGQVDQDFIIQGVAINATVTSNNHRFLHSELKQSAGTLRGVPLLVDHRNEVSAIKGRVMVGEFDEKHSRVNFKAKVVDKETQKMIKDGLIDSVSVGATVKEIEADEEGILVPKGIQFKELSLVAVPADGGATFTTALHEAYKMNHVEPAKVELKEEVVKEEVKPEIKEEVKVEVIETKTESQSPQKVDDLESMKGGIKMSEEITKVEQKVEVESETAKLIKEMTESMKAMKEEITALKAKKEVVEVEETETKGKYNIVQGFGSLKGNSYTLVR